MPCGCNSVKNNSDEEVIIYIDGDNDIKKILDNIRENPKRIINDYISTTMSIFNPDLVLLVEDVEAIDKRYDDIINRVDQKRARKNIVTEYINQLKILLEEFKKDIINYNNFYSHYIKKENIRITCRDLFYFSEFLFEEVNEKL